MRIERWSYTVPLRLRSLLRRGRVDAELDEEMRYHLERRIEELVAKGLTPREADAAARRAFGGVDLAKERCRDERRVGLLDALRQDAAYGLRTLRRTPGFTLVATLTLALGIGANAAIFSLVDAILVRPLPFPAAAQLVAVTGSYPNGAFAALRERARTLDVAAYADGKAFTLTGDGEAVRVSGALVSAELFEVLGAPAALGRIFRPGEDVAGHDRVVVLSQGLWQQRFGSRPDIVGRSIVVDGVSREIVGVMPAPFRFPSPETRMWLPLRHDLRDTVGYWAGDFMPLIGRLRPGATLAQAHAEVRLFQSGVGALFPWKMPADWNKDIAVVPLQTRLVSPVQTRLAILFGAVALVLVIACANVANLSLSRAAVREREISLRAALGAGPGRIVRQLLTESVLLAALGAGLGLLLAGQALAILKRALPIDTPRLAEVQMNWRVLAFAGTLAIVTGCAFGLAPILQARRANLTQALESGGRGGGSSASLRLRTALAMGQIALAVLLVTGAGLLIRSLWLLAGVDPGFQSAQVVTARISPSESVCREPARCLDVLSRADWASPGGSGSIGRGARERPAARRRRAEAVVRHRRLRGRGGKGRTALLVERGHPRLLSRDGDSDSNPAAVSTWPTSPAARASQSSLRPRPDASGQLRPPSAGTCGSWVNGSGTPSSGWSPMSARDRPDEKRAGVDCRNGLPAPCLACHPRRGPAARGDVAHAPQRRRRSAGGRPGAPRGRGHQPRRGRERRARHANDGLASRLGARGDDDRVRLVRGARPGAGDHRGLWRPVVSRREAHPRHRHPARARRPSAGHLVARSCGRAPRAALAESRSASRGR